MKLLAEISPYNKELDTKDVLLKVRKKVVGLMIQDDKICMIFAQNQNSYSLPGGGVDAGETLEEALQREMLEETGFEIEILKELGMTIEYLYDFNVLQMTFSYLIKPVKDTLQTNLTEDEIERGAVAEWVKIDEITEKVSNNQELHIGEKIMKKRTEVLMKELVKHLK